MDFSVIFQLRTKKFWWMDVIFYLVISLLIATVFCYLIFLIKNNIQREDIKKEIVALQTVGTLQQKEYEKDVMGYQKKIMDFTGLLENHEFASNVFAFMQAQTMPNIWFKQFGLDRKNSSVQLSGEADNLDAFSRQVAGFEKNRYVENITALNSSLGTSARIGFNINLVLDQNIFGYLVDIASLSGAVTFSDQPLIQGNQTAPEGPGGSAAGVGGAPEATEGKSSEKLITSFHLLLSPEVIGTINEASYTIVLSVPAGTDVKNLVPSIVTSLGATVSPASGASQNFENPVTYTVVAEDGSVQDYMVQVVVASQPGSEEGINKKSGQSGYVVLLVVVIIIILAAATIIFLALRKRSKNKMSGVNNI